VAAIRANDALCGLILGDAVRSERGVDSEMASLITDYEKLAATDPLNATTAESAGYKALQQSRQEFLSRQSNFETTTNLRKGQLPPGVQTSSWVNEDNTFAYSLAIWLPSASERAKEAGEMMQNSNILGGSSSSSSSPGGAGQPKGPDPKKGPSGQVQSDDAL
jgi:PIN domain nuclease of toxin-antitoxin system